MEGLYFHPGLTWPARDPLGGRAAPGPGGDSGHVLQTGLSSALVGSLPLGLLPGLLPPTWQARPFSHALDPLVCLHPADRDLAVPFHDAAMAGVWQLQARRFPRASARRLPVCLCPSWVVVHGPALVQESGDRRRSLELRELGDRPDVVAICLVEDRRPSWRRLLLMSSFHQRLDLAQTAISRMRLSRALAKVD